jgi:hypothetical protein
MRKLKTKKVIHLIASGSSMTFCGLIQSKEVAGTSLGLTCTCKRCYEIADKIMEKHHPKK